MLSICKKEAVTQQIYQATVEIAKTAKSLVQKLLSSWHDFLQTFMINANPVLVKYLSEYRNSPWWVPQAAMELENWPQHCGVLVTSGSMSEIGINDCICMLRLTTLFVTYQELNHL